MKQREQANRLSITGDAFVNNIEDRIKNYHAGMFDRFINRFTREPYIEWDNIKIKGDEILIEKSTKPSGSIFCKVTKEGSGTVLQANIVLDTAIAEVLKYLIGFGVGLSGVTWLVLDFSLLILIILLLIETFIFFVTPKFQDRALDDLTDYYNRLINQVITE